LPNHDQPWLANDLGLGKPMASESAWSLTSELASSATQQLLAR